MPDQAPLAIKLIEWALFPLLAVAALAVFWAMGAFGKGYLSAGPKRRLHLPTPIWVICLIVAAIHPLLSLLSLIAGSGPPPADGDDATQPSSLMVLRQLSQLSQLNQLNQLSQLLAPGVLLGLALAMADGARRVGLARPGIMRQLGIGALLAIPAGMLAIGLNAMAGLVGLVIGDPAPTLGHTMLLDMIREPTAEKVAGIAVLAVILAPLTEEMSYRGLAQTVIGDRLGRSLRWATVISVGLIFAAIHLHAVTWHALPGLAALGIVWGAAYERTGSLWVPIAAHAVFNAINILIVIVMM